MQLEQLLTERYSVREFSDRQVTDEDLYAVLEAGRVAPSAMNNQPLHVFCVRTPAMLDALGDCSPCIYGAKTVLVICGDETAAWRNEDGTRDSVDTDCAIAAAQMMLMCTERGLGSCYVFRFDADRTKSLLSLPQNLRPHAFLPIGYSKAEPSPRHCRRKGMTDYMTIL